MSETPTIVIETSKAATEALPGVAKWQHFPEADLYYAEVTEAEVKAIVSALQKGGHPARAIDQNSGADLTVELASSPAQEAQQAAAAQTAAQVIADKVAQVTKDMPYNAPEGAPSAFRPAQSDGKFGLVRVADGTFIPAESAPGKPAPTAEHLQQMADNLNRVASVPRGGASSGPKNAPPLAQSPVLPPTVEGKSLGAVTAFPNTLRVLDREVADAPAKLDAYKVDVPAAQGQEAKKEVRYRLQCGDFVEAEKRSPSVAFDGQPSTPANFRDDQVKVGFGATYSGPMYLSHSRRGFAFVTTHNDNPGVVKGMRVAVISMPGELVVKPADGSPAIVVSQGKEALRLNGGHLTKAVVAVQVDPQGTAQACKLVAYRHFDSKTKKYPDGTPKTFLTPKYEIDIGPEGWKVTQYDGKKTVREYQALQKEVKPQVEAAIKAANPDGMPSRETLDAQLAERGLHIETKESGTVLVGKTASDMVPLQGVVSEEQYAKLAPLYPKPAGDELSQQQARSR